MANAQSACGLAHSPFIGTAGWSIPPEYANFFSRVGTHLERYATRLNAVEINSSFYRPHRRATYERWAQSVPAHFRFAVKVPREITHALRLMASADQVDSFAAQIDGLGAKLGVVLAQLPPSLAFDESSASKFFDVLRARVGARSALACEPRHKSWFSAAADLCLVNLKVARIAADPPRALEDGKPGGWRALAYYRLHGAPRIYYSNYDAEALASTRRSIDENCARGIETWCIFDNTAAFAALGNALAIGAVNP
jgi:uncharacterized protein YecE (DUF72 family)